MKYGIIAVLALLLTIISVSAITTPYGDLVDASSGDVQVGTVKYEPYPANPGRYVDVWLRVVNGGIEKDDIVFDLVPKYPFSLDEGEKTSRTFMQLDAGGSALMHYKVRVATDAVEGSTPLYYTVSPTGHAKISSNINIWVQTMDANVAVNAVKTDAIAPGEAKPVAIEVENMGDSPLSDVNIKLDLTGSDNPFVPINSTSEMKLPFLEPRAKGNITFTLMALPSSKAGTYKVPIETKFIDGTGKNYTRSSVIGLTVGSRPDISVTIADSKIYGNGDNNVISLKFTNKGLTDIKFLNVVLQDTNNYTVVSENSLYLGNIDSDDYETADYRIKATKVRNNMLPLVVELNYLDANNVKYSETRTVDMKVFSAKDQGVTSGGSGFGTIIFLAILIGGGYYFYRRWEKSKLLRKK